MTRQALNRKINLWEENVALKNFSRIFKGFKILLTKALENARFIESEWLEWIKLSKNVQKNYLEWMTCETDIIGQLDVTKMLKMSFS